MNDGNLDNDRSIILTAAHCVHEGPGGGFAESAIFIPNQAGTDGSRTDFDCNNDPLGCWVVDFGVVSNDWVANAWPNSIPWDYGFYALGNDSDPQYPGSGLRGSLDNVTTPMDVSFDAADATVNVYTRALGYSYSDDPNFMYCGEPVTDSSYQGLLLRNCGLSGGASGGPWSQSTELNLGKGPIISVNSYGPSRGKPYMGGPRLSGNDAECLFDAAKLAGAGSTVSRVGC
ncbi:hypothetical protein E2F43_15045 [Seongchinamella unica]|uniref:Serine protease n=1 Tax=Seongchinamella unica TaxID=2547392 RepID=A0A4V6PIX0_9GAMM|nr:hypothetical protein E2F43_15045 [Seongchinamella unica]